MRVAIWCACLAAVLLLPLSADELTTLSASLKLRIVSADKLLMLAEQDLTSVRRQLATAQRLNSESESAWTERQSAWLLSEQRLEAEIAQLQAEKAELERQDANSKRDSAISTALIESLRSERAATDRKLRRRTWTIVGLVALAGFEGWLIAR